MSLMQKVNLWGEDIPFLSGLREKGQRSFEKHGLPNAKTEAWKYTYFKEQNLQNPQIDNTPLQCDGHCKTKEKLPFDAIQIKYCNGKPHIENLTTPRGVVIKSLVEAIFDNDLKAYLNKSFDVDEFPFAALNTAYLEQGLFILIERGAVPKKPIYIHYHNHDDKNRLCNIRNIIVAENGARAVITEHFDGEKKAIYTQNIVNEIFIGIDAELQHYIRQDESLDAYHIAFNSIQIKSKGSYSAFYAGGRCRLSRNESYVRLHQEGASATVNGVYRLRENGQVSDITTNIRHLAPHTYSNQLVKGVAEVAAKGVFQGQIHIAPDSQQCEGYQLHRALLIDEDAEIACKPELEIFADDVKCSHGASSGDLDKEQIFYMQSRGICEDDARQILVEAYLNEVFSLAKNQEIAEWLRFWFLS